MLIFTGVNEEKKIVSVWLTNAEKQDPELCRRLQDICAQYRARNYRTAVFFPGTENLYDNTQDLLRYNRRCMAEKEVLQEKRSGADP